MPFRISDLLEDKTARLRLEGWVAESSCHMALMGMFSGDWQAVGVQRPPLERADSRGIFLQVGKRLEPSSQPSLPPWMFYHVPGGADVSDHQGRMALLPRAAWRERTQHCSRVELLLLHREVTGTVHTVQKSQSPCWMQSSRPE